MNSFSGIKNYECEICGKQFYRKTHVTSHMRIHNKKSGDHVDTLITWLMQDKDKEKE